MRSTSVSVPLPASAVVGVPPPVLPPVPPPVPPVLPEGGVPASVKPKLAGPADISALAAPPTFAVL